MIGPNDVIILDSSIARIVKLFSRIGSCGSDREWYGSRVMFVRESFLSEWDLDFFSLA